MNDCSKTDFGKLYNGDCLEILPQLSDESIDFILTDPPYFITEEVSIIRRGNLMKYKGKDIDFKEGTEWDRMWKDKKEYLKWLYRVLDEFARVLKRNKHLVMFCDKRDISHLIDYGEKIGFKLRTPLFFRKTNPTPQARQISPMKSIEIMAWLTKGDVKRDNYNWQLGMVSDVIEAPIPQKEGSIKRHPTQKPLFLGLWLVSRFSKPAEVVLDPFAGSGTFLLCAKTLGRNYIGMELDNEWFYVANERIEGGSKKAFEIAKKLYNDLYGVKPSTVSIEEFDELFWGNTGHQKILI